MGVDWVSLLGIFVTLILSLFGAFKWFINWAEKRDDEQEKYFNKRISDVCDEIQGLDDRIDKLNEDFVETRSKFQDEYVKHSEIEGLRKELREDFNNVFQKMGGISKALNQLIGVVNGKVNGG